MDVADLLRLHLSFFPSFPFYQKGSEANWTHIFHERVLLFETEFKKIFKVFKKIKYILQIHQDDFGLIIILC